MSKPRAGQEMQYQEEQDEGGGEGEEGGGGEGTRRSIGNGGGGQVQFYDQGGGGNGNGNATDDEEEDEYENPEDLIRAFANDPHMDRIHEAQYRALLQTYDRVDEEVREGEADYKKIRVRREEIGVELYNIQQQLARMQVSLESTHQAHADLEEERAKAVLEVDSVKEMYQKKKSVCAELKKQYAKNNAELNALQETLRQVELYNEEMKGEILVTRRATYKVEEAIQALEKAKGRQDLYIDGLMNQVKQLQEEAAMLESQFDTQHSANGEVDAILRETAKEMELIAFEKKQLLQQLESSVIGIKRREEALAATLRALRAAEAAARDYDMEIEGLRRDINKAQAFNETLITIRDRLENEVAYVDEQLAKVKQERESLAERYALLQRSLVQTEEEEKKMEVVSHGLALQVDHLHKNVQMVMQEKQKLEAERLVIKNHQMTASIAVKNLFKQTQAAVSEYNIVEINQANLENEAARIRVDSLNTEAHNSQLREMLKQLEDEVKSKDKLIEKYEMEQKQRQDEIEKKIYREDRLNKKYKLLMENVNGEPESMGPLEATINNLTKELRRVEDEGAKLKHEWLQDQTQLVSTVTQTEHHLELNRELSARLSILGQRKLRLVQDCQTNKAELNRLNGVIEAVHMDMARLNRLIGANKGKAAEYANSTAVMEREFVQELKALERESMEMEERVRSVKQAKADIHDEIIETQRQIELWEKKIQLEKETHAALDPEAGKSEVANMEREIHRMKLRWSTLKREQEGMIKEMEAAIIKREEVSARYKGKHAKARASRSAGSSSGTGGSTGVSGGRSALSAAALKRELVATKKKLKITTNETTALGQSVNEKKNETTALTQELEESSTKYEQLLESRRALEQDINTALYEKQRLLEVSGTKTRLAKRFNDIAKGATAPVPTSEAMSVEQSLFVAETQLESVRDIIKTMSGQFESSLDDVLNRVLTLAEDATVP